MFHKDWRKNTNSDGKREYIKEDIQNFHKNFNLASWMTNDTPENQKRYNFTHTSEFFPCAKIKCLHSPVALKTKLNSEIKKVKCRADCGDLALNDFIIKQPVDGYLVLHKGKIVYEKYPRMRATDNHIWWSVSKTMIGAITNILAEKKKIDLDQPIETYIANFAKTDWQGIPVRHILDQCSGMSDKEDRELKKGFLTLLRPSREVANGIMLGLAPQMIRLPKSRKEFIKRFKKIEKSGQAFKYNSLNAFVMSLAIEEITHKAYNEIVSEYIWQHIGADFDAEILIGQKNGDLFSEGGISSTLRDLGRYGLLYTPSWNVVSKERIISQSYINKIQKDDRNGHIYNKGIAGPVFAKLLREQPSHASYQWDAVMKDGDFMKFGLGGQGLYVSYDKDLVIAWFSSGNTAHQDNTITCARHVATSGLF